MDTALQTDVLFNHGRSTSYSTQNSQIEIG